MNRSPVDDGTCCNEARHKGHSVLSDRAGQGNLPMVRDQAHTITKYLKDYGVIGIAQARRRLDQRIKHPLQIEGRPADDLQDVGGGRLLFQSLCQLARPRLHLLEQPRVLDSDDGLVCKDRHQLDLSRREGRNPRAIQREQAHRPAIAHERYAQHAARARDAREVTVGVRGVFHRIRDVHRPAFRDRAADKRAAAHHLANSAQRLHHLGRYTIPRPARKRVVVPYVDGHHLSMAKARGGGHERVEYGLKVEFRPADGAQYLRRRRLLFERVLQLPRPRLLRFKQACVLDGDDGLISEGLDKCNLLIAEGASGPPIEREKPNNLSTADQGNPDCGPETGGFGEILTREFWVGQHIRKMHDASLKECASWDRTSGESRGIGCEKRMLIWSQAKARHNRVPIALALANLTKIGLAKCHRRVDKRVEDSLEIKL